MKRVVGMKCWNIESGKLWSGDSILAEEFVGNREMCVK